MDLLFFLLKMFHTGVLKKPTVDECTNLFSSKLQKSIGLITFTRAEIRQTHPITRDNPGSPKADTTVDLKSSKKRPENDHSHGGGSKGIVLKGHKMDPISCPENGPIFGSEELSFPNLIRQKKVSLNKNKNIACVNKRNSILQQISPPTRRE